MQIQHSLLGAGSAHTHSPFRWVVPSVAQLESAIHPTVTAADIGKVAWLQAEREAWVLIDDQLPFGTAWSLLGVTTPTSSDNTPDTLVLRDGLGGFSAEAVLATAYIETRVALPSNEIDLSTGNYFSYTVAEAAVFSVTNVPDPGKVASFLLDLTNGGDFSVTWWPGVEWASATAPQLSSGGRDVLSFYTHDGGVTWTGILVAKDVG